MRFFAKPSAQSAADFISPNDFTISLTTKNSQPTYYGPGATIHGRVHLHLNKPIAAPCELRVVFACHQTILPSAPSSLLPPSTPPRASPSIPRRATLLRKNSSPKGDEPRSAIFEVEHLLLTAQILPACRRQAPHHFSIKLPLCSYPPSIEDGHRSVTFSIRAILSFETTPGDVASRVAATSCPARIMYLPLVPASAPPPRAAAMAVGAAGSGGGGAVPVPVPVREASATLTVDAAVIDASVKGWAGVCIGETAAMVLQISNRSHVDLQSIHLALVRHVSYATAPRSPPNTASMAGAGHLPSTQHPHTLPESTTVHSATIPIARVSNAQSTWTQQLQFRLPTNLGLIPSIDSAITPLLELCYSILISIPIPRRHNSLIRRLASSPQIRLPLNLSVFNPNGDSSSTDALLNHPQRSPKQVSSPALAPSPALPARGPTALEFAPIPIVIGTLPSQACQKKFKWPIPNYLEVTDRPAFVRDRIEEEMIQYLSTLESLGMEDDIDFESLVQAARKGGSLGGDSDDEDDPSQARVPVRFRSNIRTAASKDPPLVIGLDTPPPSPPQVPTPATDDVLDIHSMRNSSPGAWSSPSGRVVRRSTSSRSFGLGKDLLVEMQQQRIQQQHTQQ